MPLVFKALSEAIFVSWDTELTGLTTGEQTDVSNRIDSPEERYIKVRNSALHFSVVQFGLCCWTYSSEKKS